MCAHWIIFTSSLILLYPIVLQFYLYIVHLFVVLYAGWIMLFRPPQTFFLDLVESTNNVYNEVFSYQSLYTFVHGSRPLNKQNLSHLINLVWFGGIHVSSIAYLPQEPNKNTDNKVNRKLSLVTSNFLSGLSSNSTNLYLQPVASKYLQKTALTDKIKGSWLKLNLFQLQSIQSSFEQGFLKQGLFF